MTPGERLIQLGEERGIQKGIQQGLEQRIQQGLEQGIQQGFQQGERALLLRLLRKRFGHQVDSDSEQRLATASSEQVAVWTDRLLLAGTLAELLAD